MDFRFNRFNSKRYISRWDFSEFSITSREIIASISIVVFLLLIGSFIANKINDAYLDKQEIYNKAVKISTQDLFQYSMDTNIGYGFVYGELKALDPVTFEEIGGEYSYIRKDYEEYVQKTRIVTKYEDLDGDGEDESYTETETYWEWDVQDTWQLESNRKSFLGIEFESSKLPNIRPSHIKTINISYDERYVYYASPVSKFGTIFTTLKDKTIWNTQFYQNQTIDETLDALDNNFGLVFFWIFWVILIVSCVFCFFYFENKWLY